MYDVPWLQKVTAAGIYGTAKVQDIASQTRQVLLGFPFLLIGNDTIYDIPTTHGIKRML